MPKSEADLKKEIERLDASEKETMATISHVRKLLNKADQRREEDGDRRWDEILDNLESTLDMGRSKLTACGQRLREARDQLRQLQATGFIEDTGIAIDATDAQPPLTEDRLKAAQQIMSMSVDDLRSLTLDEVADMHDELFRKTEAETAEAAAEPKPEPPAPAAPKTALDRRIEKARRAKEEREAARRKSAGFVERRKQGTLRAAVGKLLQGGCAGLTIEEAESVLECRGELMGRSDLSDSEQRLKEKLEPMGADIEARLHELRRKRARGYLRRRP
ncbi:MAG: hypothetical protein GWP08_01135 [Nitrospiraceae bacterium]|nr:hypothetical protein [Nitrospiraceae bacterium]